MLRVVEYGLVVSSVPRLTPSILNWIPTTPMLSDALAETVTEVPEIVELFEGEIREMVGGVVSGGATNRLKLV